MIGLSMALLLALGTPLQAMPVQAAETCGATLAPELAGWRVRVPVRAGAASAAAPPLTLGRSASATLVPAATLTYAVTPQKPAAPASTGGLFAFTVPHAGRYRVALGSGAWIDVVEDGQAAGSVAHGHGPACSGIHKTVDFDLRAGRHLLQIVGSDMPTLVIMVAPAPH